MHGHRRATRGRDQDHMAFLVARGVALLIVVAGNSPKPCNLIGGHELQTAMPISHTISHTTSIIAHHRHSTYTTNTTSLRSSMDPTDLLVSIDVLATTRMQDLQVASIQDMMLGSHTRGKTAETSTHSPNRLNSIATTLSRLSRFVNKDLQ